MDIHKLIDDLKGAKEQYDEVFGTQRLVENSLIKEEVELLKKFTKPLFGVAETIEVHADDALLIFDYKNQDKTLISSKVYLSKSDFKIKYEVYDEEKYRRHRRNAYIVDGWNIMEPSEFLQYITLENIFDFFNERPSYLYDRSEKYVEFNKKRKQFINNFRTIVE